MHLRRKKVAHRVFTRLRLSSCVRSQGGNGASCLKADATVEVDARVEISDRNGDEMVQDYMQQHQVDNVCQGGGQKVGIPQENGGSAHRI